MKSAYELAMERLEKETPKSDLTDDQKTRLAEIDKKINAKVAERKTYLHSQIDQARATAQLEALAQLEAELANDIRRLEDQREAEKQKIRDTPQN